MSGYRHQARLEVEPYVPSCSTLLDLGCAAGGFGRALMDRRPGLAVDGIEPDVTAAEEAARHYRRVWTGTFPEIRPDGVYEVVVCNDVLEHTVDPWGAVAALRDHLGPGGVVVASIPNVRHWPVLRGLLQGRWDYRDDGVMDRTHLRWFTRATMVELFEQAGFTVRTVESLTGLAAGWKWALPRLVARRQVDDLLTKQYVVMAAP